MPPNPAALLWALAIGCDARISEQTEREVRAMNKSYECRVQEEIDKGHRYGVLDIANEADARIRELEAQLAAATERERVARQLLIDAHEPDQGQQRTEWDERVDAWLAASDGQEGK